MTRTRSAYHHGDLRNAMVGAAVEIAREEGPHAVTIRAAARAVGVTPTAAYRHFENHEALLEATKQVAYDRLNAAMDARLAEHGPTGDRTQDALMALVAIGRGYLDFALTDTGLFRTAFTGETGFPPIDQHEEDSPFRMLSRAMDELVAAGFLDAGLRPGVDVVAWAQMHGLATLYLDGPLAGTDAAEREALFNRSVQVLFRGLASHSTADVRPVGDRPVG